jgi:hypothetical protein
MLHFRPAVNSFEPCVQIDICELARVRTDMIFSLVFNKIQIFIKKTHLKIALERSGYILNDCVEVYGALEYCFLPDPKVDCYAKT